MYKLTAIDIDGTLLNDKDQLLPGVKSALEEAVEAGHMVVLCTGRGPSALKSVQDLFDFDMPFICYHGAVIVQGKDGKILYQQKMNTADVIGICKEGTKRDVTMHLWTMDGTLAVSRIDPFSEYYIQKTHTPVNQVVLFDENSPILKEDIAKMMFHAEPNTIDRYLKECESFTKDMNINYNTSQPIFLEFIDKDVSKANAIQALIQQYHIKQEEVIAIGDGLNDLPMIEYAGLGVAMGNAKDYIKNAAQYIAPTNNEEGVAEVINRFVLGKLK